MTSQFQMLKPGIFGHFDSFQKFVYGGLHSLLPHDGARRGAQRPSNMKLLMLVPEVAGWQHRRGAGFIDVSTEATSFNDYKFEKDTSST